MNQLVRRFFSVERMVKKEHLHGELPTTKEAYSTLVKIAMPSVFEMVFTSLIGFIDTMMVSVLGKEAIAAVGLTGQPRMLMLAVFFALNIGVTAIVARRRGQGLKEEANRTLRNALVIIIALSGIMMALGITYSRPLLLFAGAEADTIEMAVSYFDILAWFLPINALTMCINAAQRGIGNTRIAMYSNTAANIVNVIFNYLLIGGNFGFPALGVAGAAYATAIGFCVGLALSVTSLILGQRHGSFLRLSFKDNWRLDKETIKSITKVGGGAMIEQIILRFGFFFYAKIVAGLGTAIFAAHQTAMQFLNISFTFGDGLAAAATALVGRSLGMKRPDLSVMYGKCSQRLALIVSLLLAAVVVTLRYPLISLFLDPAAAENAVSFPAAVEIMLMVALFQPVQTSSVVISGCLRGAGDNFYVAAVMLVCVAIIRPTLSLIAINVLGLGLVGAWSSSLIDMCLRLILVYKRFSGGKWHNIKV